MSLSRILPILATALSLSACAPPKPVDPPPPAAEAAPSSVAAAPPVPANTYLCEDGRSLQALYPDRETAQVKLAGSSYLLKIAVSGSGARYVGEGLQWWTKGDEGQLARMKPGEKIAADPGVRCGLGKLPEVEPPAPGTPGGLPDDRTPLPEMLPVKAGSAQAAYAVVETYYALVESGKMAEAAKLRTDGLQEDVRALDTLHAQIGGPGKVEGAAGSLFVDVPVVLYGRYKTGAEYHRSGQVTLRRVNGVEGATPDQLKWRIAKIETQ